jgi:hypothetical protein
VATPEVIHWDRRGTRQIEATAYAFESICQERKLRPVKDDNLRELVAQKVIDFAQRGVNDPQRLREVVASAIKL